MTIPYFVRLLCLCAATFFLVNAALGLALHLAANSIIRFAHRMTPREATRFLLLVRFLPLVITAFVVLGVCLPSYLWLEPAATNENVGSIFVLAALCGAFIWFSLLLRTGKAVVVARHFAQECKESCAESKLSGVNLPVEILESDTPVLLLAGVFRHRLVLSTAVIRTLSPEQLISVTRHEDAHRASRDNLKRLLLLLSPGILPFSRSYDSIERAWAQLSEWAADDDASGNDAALSLTLAESLVRVARLGATPRPSPLCTSLIPPDQDLSARVNRLLLPPSFEGKLWRRMGAMIGGAACVLIVILTVLLVRPTLLQSVHELLERLTH
jgi:Zn-dependent protease with chaperone function